MKFVSLTLLSFVAVLFSHSAYAQLDSSYELLLGVPVPTSTLKGSVTPKKAVKKRQTASEANVGGNVGTPVAQTVPTGRPLPIKLEPAAGEAQANAGVVTQPSNTNPEPTFSDQAQSILTAQPEKVLTYYNDHLEPTDPRQNKVEISFAPTFVTNESSSNYSFRQYRSVFSAVSVGANVWLTPAMGLGGTFLFSLGADTSGDAASGTRSQARHESFDLALKFRQFFGFTERSKSVEYDLLYTDYKFNVPSDDVYRVRLKTSGVGLKTSLHLPSSADFSWIIGGSFYPRLQHRESIAAAAISSGENSENTRIGLHLGAELKLSKESQLFWEASASSERNLFTGSASLTDPATGATPKNVSVTNSFYLMNFGYRWGN